MMYENYPYLVLYSVLWKTRFRTNVIKLIEETMANVDHKDEGENQFERLLCSCILTTFEIKLAPSLPNFV